MKVFRLDSIAPAVADSFRRASPAMRRKAALVACEYAAASVAVSEPAVTSALNALREATTVDSSVLHQLRRLVAAYDDEYLRLDSDVDSAHREKAMDFFSRARAISALVFALSPNDIEVHEAIYEACAVAGDPGELLRAVERAFL